MLKIILPLLMVTAAQAAVCQPAVHQTNHFPAGCFYHTDTRITGISYGLWSLNENLRHTTTIGLRLEALGEGAAAPFISGALLSEKDSSYSSAMKEPVSEHVYGINISVGGSGGNFRVSGISIGGVGQIITVVNGIAVSGFSSTIEKMSGLQVSIVATTAYDIKGMQLSVGNFAAHLDGLQIGLFNNSKHTRGIQIGVWNKNERRKWPLINWNFRDKA